MALTLGPVIGTVGGDTWEEHPFEELNVGRLEERVLLTAAPPPPRIWRLRSSSSWTSSLALAAQEDCSSGPAKCHSLPERALPGMCSRQRRRSRFREEATSALPTHPSPARSTRCLCPTDLGGL